MRTMLEIGAIIFGIFSLVVYAPHPAYNLLFFLIAILFVILSLIEIEKEGEEK